MATIAITDYSVTIFGADHSNHVTGGSLEYEAEALDDTVMGDTTRSMKGGLKNWRIRVEGLADEAAGEANATEFANVGTTGTITLRPTSAAVSATNPNYTGTALCTSFTPIGGTVGEMQKFVWEGVAAGNLSRATS